MGIKTMITPSQLPPKYQQNQLIPTIDGVTSSVYMLDDIFVLKLFDKETPLKQIESEIKFLKSFDNLAVAKVVDRFDIDEYQVIIYTQIKGKIITNPTIKHIEEIGIFLRNFHKQSRNILTLKQDFFSKKELKRAINLTSNPILLKYFDRIKIELKSDGIIHGDLFPDNCKFQDYKLSGVYDFSDACIGDFNFELGVVASSWCFDKNILNEKKVKTLLKAYGSNIDREAFQPYVQYALLYYATQRFIAKHDYPELLERLEIIL